MKKEAFFCIDDVIWCLRDVAREKPKSIFEQPYFKLIKECHDKWSMTCQLNLFYSTDNFYGNDIFTLAEVPDTYKSEFEANSDWLKFAFHARQEFPDYPYVNGTYEDVKEDYELVIKEIKRFAGEKSISYAVIPHWLPISKAGCQAMYDCGTKFLSPSAGIVKEYDGNPDTLPYGHSFRLLHNRQPETKLFTRNTNNTQITASICAYNHITEEQKALYNHKNTSILDEGTGIRYRQFGGGPCLNLHTVEDIHDKLMAEIEAGHEYIGVGNHEQYFYPEYFAYQPDMGDKFRMMAKTLHDAGYTFITADDFE